MNRGTDLIFKIVTKDSTLGRVSMTLYRGDMVESLVAYYRRLTEKADYGFMVVYPGLLYRDITKVEVKIIDTNVEALELIEPRRVELCLV